MGSYLDKPETTKNSEIGENDLLQIGSSSMQGWRINQEDAHNSILDFAEKTAFFAVYDGHGGAEVAEYCSKKLPQFLKELDSFKAGNFEQALRDAFIGFDATLLDDKVIEELRQLARKNPDYEESDMDDNDESVDEEIMSLQQEAQMPLKEVLQLYGKKEGFATDPEFQQLLKKLPRQKETAEAAAGGPSSSGAGGSSGGSSSRPSGSGSSTSPKKSASDNEVSSSSSKPSSENDADTAEPSSSSSAIPEQAPDSTLTIPALAEGSSSAKQPEQSTTAAGSSANGAIKASDSKEKSNDDEAISSSSTQENGETSSCPSSSGGGSVSGSTNSPKTPKISNHISSSSLPDTDTDSSDDENDETYKESPVGPKPVNSDGDTTDEEVDGEDEEMEDEELSGEEEEDDAYDDEFMNNMESGPGKASGCTAVVALMSGRDLYVANAGDSRCVVCRAGKVVEMSFDHKPEDEIEYERIRKAGGRVTNDGRVNGGLNLSRAIGDHGYKMNKELPAEAQMISALPDLKRHIIEPEDEFMVLACDGIWNYMTNEEVVGFVKQRMDAGKLTLAEICEQLFHNCLAPSTVGDGTGCDNMTAIIVKFKPALFDLPAPQVAPTNEEPQKNTRKRSCDDGEAEALPAAEKRQKIEDDLTPAAVDTSTA